MKSFKSELKEDIKNKQLTDRLLLACLATLEDNINKNAYLEKKWINCPYDGGIPGELSYEQYKSKRLELMDKRKKIRDVIYMRYKPYKVQKMIKNIETDKKAYINMIDEVISIIESTDKWTA